jgi:endonuclease/exonuclease/phosphatase family metal-dependent hydrolase
MHSINGGSWTNSLLLTGKSKTRLNLLIFIVTSSCIITGLLLVLSMETPPPSRKGGAFRSPKSVSPPIKKKQHIPSQFSTPTGARSIDTATTTFHFNSFKIVSMNLAACEPSAEAPSHWTPDHVAKAVRQELLTADPDILALQECPMKPKQWVESYWKGFQLVGVASSHAFYTILLVRDSIAPYTTPVTLPTRLPAVMAMITNPQDKQRAILVASCHLAPFGEGAHKRARQMRSLVQTAPSNHPLIIAGDTNMRQEEDEVMEGIDLSLIDAWKAAGEDPTTKFTWDTKNRIANGGFFNRFYGKNTREYNARYDRIYIQNALGPNALQLSVESFKLIANRPVSPDNKTHFLSDHFGMACELKLEEP